MPNKIAATMPGKMGDAIFAIPTIRWLSEKHNTKIDFWTSQYCSPLKRLFEYQTCIENFYVSPSYELEHMQMGCQPWLVPIHDEYQYEQVYHLGFRGYPIEKGIINYIADSVGAPMNLPLKYDYPDIETLDKYVVVAPRGEERWRPVIARLAVLGDVVQIGSLGDKVSELGIDRTGLDFLETLAWISKARVFMGCRSSQLVLAKAFDIPCYTNPPNIRDTIFWFT